MRPRRAAQAVPRLPPSSCALSETRRGGPSGAECVYLQETLLWGDGTGQLKPHAPLGPQMAEDLARGLDGQLLGAILGHAQFGPPARSQLFVGGAAADHARTVLHFDQYGTRARPAARAARVRCGGSGRWTQLCRVFSCSRCLPVCVRLLLLAAGIIKAD